MNKMRTILIAILICVATGFISALFQADSIATWYPTLNKSALTPSSTVFSIAWTILYICMGISIGLVLTSEKPKKIVLAILFGIQLFLNFIWSIIFFGLQNPLAALMIMGLLLVLIIGYARKAYPDHKISAYLFVPYIAWVIFAMYLNLYVVMNN